MAFAPASLIVANNFIACYLGVIHLKEAGFIFMVRITLLILGLLTSTFSYSKCRADFIETEPAFNNAKNVIWVYVNSAEALESHGTKFKASFEVIDSFKGSYIKGDSGTVFYASSSTSFLLTPGQPYILYLSGNNFVSRCLGSKKYIWHMDKGALRTKLEQLRAKGV